MASIKYRPESVEFYAPDTFERLGEMSYCTVDNAVAAAKNYVLTSNCDGAFTIADYADTASKGYTSGMVNIKTTTDDLQEQIDSLRSAIDELKERLVCVPQTKKNRMSELRRELKTLRGAP